MGYKRSKTGVEYITQTDWRRDSMRNRKFREAYKALKPKYDIIRAILDARLKKGVTQAELARRVGTTQSAIARFESGAGNPTLDFLSKVSSAIGARLEVRIAR
ncbi:MAG: helix-turn-helix transcriptional regulator [Minisyncoccia bacterium]